jgi:hypothetical protein
VSAASTDRCGKKELLADEVLNEPLLEQLVERQEELESVEEELLPLRDPNVLPRDDSQILDLCTEDRFKLWLMMAGMVTGQEGASKQDYCCVRAYL